MDIVNHKGSFFYIKIFFYFLYIDFDEFGFGFGFGFSTEPEPEPELVKIGPKKLNFVKTIIFLVFFRVS